jgi:hypothetical protein
MNAFLDQDRYLKAGNDHFVDEYCSQGDENAHLRCKHNEEIIVLLTGYAAEVKSSPEMEALITSECLNNELQGDFPNARYEMQCIDGPREEYDLEYWKARARQFIEGDWKAIEAVAVELLQRCRLTSCEVKQIMSFTDSRLS